MLLETLKVLSQEFPPHADCKHYIVLGEDTNSLILGLWVDGTHKRFTMLEDELNDPAKLVYDIKSQLASCV